MARVAWRGARLAAVVLGRLLRAELANPHRRGRVERGQDAVHGREDRLEVFPLPGSARLALAPVVTVDTEHIDVFAPGPDRGDARARVPVGCVGIEDELEVV